MKKKGKRGAKFFGESRRNWPAGTCRWCGKKLEHFLYFCDACEMERTAMLVEEEAQYHDSAPLGCGRRKNVKIREVQAFKMLAGLEQ